MKKSARALLPIYIVVLCVFLIAALIGSRAVTVISQGAPIKARKCVVIDAGHGGVDGGATSCTGVFESNINLEIALRLNDLLHLLGIDTLMIRDSDISVYTYGNTIASKKISDLKERVRMISTTEQAVVISIHQNHFSDSKYSGAQVFYAPTDGSRELAQSLQEAFKSTINPGSKRQIKQADGVYLMQHIQCPGVLVECGFLSNYEEEALLRCASYQRSICCVLASACSRYLHTADVIT